jgi:hypothetical protein
MGSDFFCTFDFGGHTTTCMTKEYVKKPYAARNKNWCKDLELARVKRFGGGVVIARYQHCLFMRLFLNVNLSK